MSNEAAIIGAVDSDSFEEQVLKRSAHVPVLVDFWAAWCSPCRMLMPLLEKIVNDYNGRIVLAKVDTDAQQALAEQFGIRSLPTVKLFKHGRVVDEFMGVQPEPEIRAMLEKHIERPSDPLYEQAMEALQNGEIRSARDYLQQARDSDPDNHPLTIELASLMLQTGDVEEAEALLNNLPFNVREEGEVKQLLAVAMFARGKIEAGENIETLEFRVKTNPDDMDLRFQLASHYILNEEYKAGLDQLVAIMEKDREYGDDLGRRAILSVFEIVGESNPLVPHYRRRMASLLH